MKFLIEHKRALLGDEMGLGKSIQLLLRSLRFRTAKIKNALLLCPKAVITDWQTKFAEWAPELRVQKVRGSQIDREISWDTPAHIYLATYESFRDDLRAKTTRSLADICILDEIQKIKNPRSKISQSVRLIQSSWRWGLSGTPIENRIEDVVAIFSFLEPTLFARQDYFSPIGVREKIKPFLLRRRKSEALPELPAKVHSEAWLDLYPQQRAAYERAEKDSGL